MNWYNFFISLEIILKYESQKRNYNPDLSTEEVKELELDEQPKPTRKISNPSIPVPDQAEPSTLDRNKKGNRS